MLRRSCLIVVFVVGYAGTAPAQQVPAAELSGGYSALVVYDYAFRAQNREETFPLGWYASITGNLSDFFGIEGEIGGSHKSVDDGLASTDVSILGFLIGPRLTFRDFESVVLFGHAMFGVMRFGGSVAIPGAINASDSLANFAVQVGGGADFYFVERVGLRLGFDYRQDFGEDPAQVQDSNQFRFNVGLVVPLGRR